MLAGEPHARIAGAQPTVDVAAKLARLIDRLEHTLPADALANARILDPGNAQLLEALAVGLGSDWGFDEYHHYPVNLGRSWGALALRAAGDEVGFRREADAALELDRLTPHKDRKLLKTLGEQREQLVSGDTKTH